MVRKHQTSDAQLRIGESRDFRAIAHLRFDAAHRPGMTRSIFAIQLAVISPIVDETAVTNVPQLTSTKTTGHVHCFSSDSDVSLKVA
jgi:hypothetical protein